MYFIYGNLKKAICLLAITMFLSVVADNCMADSASVTLISTGGGTIDLVLKNIDDNQPAAGGLITWSDVDAGQTSWKIANQYIEISHNDLPQSWGIQLYTDNKNVSANPKYTGTADPAGLIKTDKTIMALPIAWKITDSVISNPSNPIERLDGLGFGDYMWHFLKDKNTFDDPLTSSLDETFINGEDYITLWNQAGIAWNEGGRSGNPKKAYIYLAVNFTMAAVGAEYMTNKLIMEVYEGISPFPIYLYKDAPKTEWPNEIGATLENHFAPSGWYNYNNSHKIITVNSRSKEVVPYSGTHSFKINWTGSAGVDGWKWGGIMWLEPSDIWEDGGSSSTHNGYDLRGADYLSFWARTDSNNPGLQLKVGFGNEWDTAIEPILWRLPTLTTQWQQYVIPVLTRDMSDITGGIAIIFADDHDPDPDGCTIYLDDIKFDKY